MKLLIITQKVDRKDPILGFFHGWIKEFSKYYESITVICLYGGEYNLPTNVKVMSLGKESGESKIKYLKNFYKYIWVERKNYDRVFVHMNQEYVLLAGWFWKLIGKNIYMWRNHPQGSFLTDIASYFSNKVFYTSPASYTAKYENAEIMPVGINTDIFKIDDTVKKIPNSILSVGRIAPIKNIDLLLEAINLLKSKDFVLNVYGDALKKDREYLESLKNRVTELDLGDRISFHPSVSNQEVAVLFNKHKVFVNMTPKGSFDKTILEAMSCGCEVIRYKNNIENFSEEIYQALNIDNERAIKMSRENRTFVLENHSLQLLAERLNNQLR